MPVEAPIHAAHGTAPSTREALLTATLERICDVGWTSFSFRDLAQMVGIRTASIHYHFPTKGDLGLALVRRIREDSSCRKCDMESITHVGDRLRALGRMLEELTCDGTRSCPLYALQAEFPVLTPAMQQELRAWIDEKIAGLATWLEDGRARGELRFPGEARLQALLVWSVIEYGQQLARTNPTPSASFSTLIGHLVDTMTP